MIRGLTSYRSHTGLLPGRRILSLTEGLGCSGKIAGGHCVILKSIGEPGGKKEFEYRWQKAKKLMGLFKKKIVKEIQDGGWGHLLNVHKITVETLHNELRCVERKGVLDDGLSVTFIRIFNLKEVQRLGIDIKGWESFDQKPDLILFEGYITRLNGAHLEKKKG